VKREFEFDQRVERSILTTYRKELWKPFILAVKRYELIQEGDKIAVCISGGKDSMLMAKLMQELQRHSKVHFETVFLVMDPGYNEINRRKIEQNAALLNVPITTWPIAANTIPATSVRACAGVTCTARPKSWAATRLRWGIILMM